MTADDDRKRRLDKTVTDLQHRFGLRAIGRAAGASIPPAAPTGFAALDEALGIGGLPLGRLSEIIGAPTSGMATLALNVIAASQTSGAAAQTGETARGPLAAYLDLPKTFDPDYAARCGVDLNRLLVVRPYTARQGVTILPDFALNGGFGILVVDAPLSMTATPDTAEALAAALARLVAPLSRSGCALLFLSALPPGSPLTAAALPSASALAHYAAVRLLIQRERWLYHRRDVTGYEAQVLVLKNRLAAEGQTAHVAINLNNNS